MNERQQRIYLDNAATTWPKPDAVYEAVDRYQRDNGAPAGRSSYRQAADVATRLAQLRFVLGQLLDAPAPTYQTLFAYSGTDALNLALRGLIRSGDHVVTTAADHNSVLRPLHHLAQTQQVQVTIVPLGPDQRVDLDQFAAALRRPTRLAVFNHASNVTGTLQPVATMATLARDAGTLSLLDGAQTVGHVPLSVSRLGIDLLATPGHKGLFGPLGTGLLVAHRQRAAQLLPLRLGGTGSRSESDHQPAEWPDRYEAGNANVPGLLGLAAGVDFVRSQGVAQIFAHQCRLVEHLIHGLAQIPQLIYYPQDDMLHQNDMAPGPDPGVPESGNAGVVSFQLPGFDPQEAALLLESTAGIQVRAGLHCAPRMHAALGTLEQGGTIRVSLGVFNTAEHVDRLLQALRQLLGQEFPGEVQQTGAEDSES